MKLDLEALLSEIEHGQWSAERVVTLVREAALAEATADEIATALVLRRGVAKDVVRALGGVVLAEATPEQLAAVLQARPDVAIAAYDRILVAREWVPKQYSETGAVERRRSGGFAPVTVYVGHDGQWYVSRGVLCEAPDGQRLPMDVEGNFATRPEAMAAADAALVAAGWALATGGAS